MENNMQKNIIVCADVMGKNGTIIQDSNVNKIYSAIDIDFSGECGDGFKINKQVVFYSNGVNHKENKILHAKGAILGFGFENRVYEIYKYLAKNYEYGDRIYLIGFGSGASVIRACNGMIHMCGLVIGNKLSRNVLDRKVFEVFNAYKFSKKRPELAKSIKNAEDNHGIVPIQFLGVWDTVAAFGFIMRTDITGPITLILSVGALLLESILEIIWPHSFYHYELTDNVKHAVQALAIDDDRIAFWPDIFSEKNIPYAKKRTIKNIEQVWFSGSHSDIGGAQDLAKVTSLGILFSSFMSLFRCDYVRTGAASAPLHWMMRKAKSHGLALHLNDIKNAKEEGYLHNYIYNPRDGLDVSYRYQPRNIDYLSDDKILGDIKIHQSVITRIVNSDDFYAPPFIPVNFVVVNSDDSSVQKYNRLREHPEWIKSKTLISRLVFIKMKLYELMFSSLLVGLFFTIWYWNNPPVHAERNDSIGKVADTMNYILPDFLTGIIEIVVNQQPHILIISIIFLYAYLKIKKLVNYKVDAACEKLSESIINEDKKN